MQKLGKEIQRKEVHEMIAQHDRTGDGMLNFQEFKAIFFGGKEIDDFNETPFGLDGPV